MTEPEVVEEERTPRVGADVSFVTAIFGPTGRLLCVIEDPGEAEVMKATIVGATSQEVPYAKTGNRPTLGSAFCVTATITAGEVRSESHLGTGLVMSSDGRPVVSAMRPIESDGESGVVVEIQGTDIRWVEDVIARLQSDVAANDYRLVHEWMDEFGLDYETEDQPEAPAEPAEAP